MTAAETDTQDAQTADQDVLTDHDVPEADGTFLGGWQSLGLPGLVDVHVHVMPQRLLDKVWAYFDAAGPLIGRPWPITYRWSQERRLQHLRDLGVRAFPTLLYPHKPQMAASLNDWARDFAREQRAAGHPMSCRARPSCPSRAWAYVERALGDGARVFKVHVQVGGFDPRPAAGPGVGDARRRRRARGGAHRYGPRAGAFTGPGPFGEVLARHPGLTAVIAHMGMPEHAEFLDLAERYANVHLDTTMVFVDFFDGAQAQTAWPGSSPRGWPPCRTGSSSAPTSPTSPTPTPTRSRRWPAPGSMTTGCGQCCGTTAPDCSTSRITPQDPRSGTDRTGRPRPRRRVGGVMTLGIEEAVLRAKALATAPGRSLLGLTGPPGAGKSTWPSASSPRSSGSVLVGMDGFHLAHTVLTGRGTVGRKGAPDTFDAAGYVALLARLRAGEPGVVWAPEFRRDIEDAIAGAVAVPPDAPLVVTEGNYLLLPEDPWARVPELLDEVWYVDLPDATRLDRLVRRHERYGRSADQARERSFGSDEEQRPAGGGHP